MTAGDLAAVVVTLVAIGAIVAFALLAAALLRTLRELRATLASLRAEAAPLLGELRDTVERAGVEVERVDELLDTAETISATVDSASRLGYLAFRAPVIRVVAFVRGVWRGVRRLVGLPSATDRGSGGVRRRPRRSSRERSRGAGSDRRAA